MLKIKDGVDLKELEKLGFKPKYDEDTGELKVYIKEFIVKNKHYVDEKCKEYIIFEIYKINRFINKKRWCCGATWNTFDSTVLEDCLYDLIQAGFIEKV